MDDSRTESTIGERLKRLRAGALMTQDDLAAAAGVSTDLIRKLEQGRRHTASIGSLHRIAAAAAVHNSSWPRPSSAKCTRPQTGHGQGGRRQSFLHVPRGQAGQRR
jgi:transcriptional regulator with XRE-family HTH domain